jgi:rubrerythrin
MKALADEHIFSEKDRGRISAKEMSSYYQVIDIAIRIEKDSIVFYEGMKRFVPKKEIETIDKVIREEEFHLLKLTEVKKYLLAHPEK